MTSRVDIWSAFEKRIKDQEVQQDLYALCKNMPPFTNQRDTYIAVSKFRRAPTVARFNTLPIAVLEGQCNKVP